MPRSQSSCALRRVLIAVAAVVLWLGVPSRASASLIQFDFTGNWYFFDPIDHTPEFWSAMSAYGIQLGTPVSLSMVVDDTVKDSSPIPGTFAYDTAIVQVSFRAGTMAFTAGKAQMAGGGAVVIGPPLIQAVFSDMPFFGGYTPKVLDTSYFGWNGGPATGALIPFLSGWNTFSIPGLTLTFSPQYGGSYQALFPLQLVGIKTVPAPSTLVTLCGGLVAFIALAAWRRALHLKRSTPVTTISETRS